MGWEAWATIAVIVGVLYTLGTNRVGADVVLLGAMTILMTLGIFSPEKFPSPMEMAR